jgi:hypothetical protein
MWFCGFQAVAAIIAAAVCDSFGKRRATAPTAGFLQFQSPDGGAGGIPAPCCCGCDRLRLRMAIKSIRCPVLQAEVTLVTDFEGHVTRVICPEFEPADRCRLKKAALDEGPLVQLIERTAEHTLSSHDTRCVLQVA